MYRSASMGRLLSSIGLFTLIILWAFGCGTGGIKSPASPSSYGYEAYGYNGSDNARPMADGIMQTGYIEYVGDSDWFALDSGLTEEIDIVTLRVELSNQTLSSAVDLSVAVYGDVDEEVGNNDLVMIGGIGPTNFHRIAAPRCKTARASHSQFTWPRVRGRQCSA